MELYRLQTGAEAVSARNAVYRDFQSHSTFRTLVGVDDIVSWELKLHQQRYRSREWNIQNSSNQPRDRHFKLESTLSTTTMTHATDARGVVIKRVLLNSTTSIFHEPHIRIIQTHQEIERWTSRCTPTFCRISETVAPREDQS